MDVISKCFHDSNKSVVAPVCTHNTDHLQQTLTATNTNETCARAARHGQSCTQEESAAAGSVSVPGLHGLEVDKVVVMRPTEHHTRSSSVNSDRRRGGCAARAGAVAGRRCYRCTRARARARDAIAAT